MQKHRKREHRKSSFSRNANRRLSESESQSVFTCLQGLDGEGDFASDYLLKEFHSKYCDESLVPAAERRRAAVAKWRDCERRNAQTNAHLRGLDRGYNILPRVGFYSFLKFAQRLTKDILGPLHDELVLGSFSGGASTSRRRTESLPALKFTGEADVTREAAPYIDVLHRLSPLFRQYSTFYFTREVGGAELFTVPKKTDIDRCACKEPDINMFLQKGVGRHIRSRLKRFGINLNDQGINRRLARLGSISEDLCTLDLSAASDSMTISCVQALLPPDWFLYLNDIRSQSVAVDGTFVRTEMFSSMGNGFTFELESLIFYVLMRTVSYFEGIPGIISVYGDDIIIPVGMYDMACFVLGEFGFSPNPDKSFSTGPFRESCGGHYHSGVDVTPFYLKRRATHLTDVIRVANQIRLWASSDPSREFSHPALYNIWLKLSEIVPKNLWGGRDYSLDVQLVSPGAPRNRLCRVTKRVKVPPIGSYIEWHNTNWNRTREPEVGFSPVRTETLCRLRRATPGAPFPDYEFFKELVPEPVLA